MKKFLFALLLGATVLASASPVLAEVETTRPDVPEGVVVTMPPETDWR